MKAERQKSGGTDLAPAGSGAQLDAASAPNEEEEEIQKKEKRRSQMVKEATSFKEQLEQRGVVYLGRIPPFMKPNKLRSLLEPHGEITRLFLQEEDRIQRKKRMAAGGNGSKQFVEGWVEFNDKSVAKYVARALNNTLIGGKKRNFYHDDLWNIKYLKGFRWDHLTEKFAYERRIREAKLRAAMIEAKKRNAEFVNLVEQNKVNSLIQDRVKKRKQSEVDNDHSAEQGGNVSSRSMASADSADKSAKKRRTFRQSRSLGRHHGENEAQASSHFLKNIFPSK